MPRKKKDEAKEAAPKKELILPLPMDTLKSEDLNKMRDKINELVAAFNCDCK